MGREKKNNVLVVRVDDTMMEKVNQKCSLLEIKPSKYLRRLIQNDFRRDKNSEIDA